jgi:hypothetical protein
MSFIREKCVICTHALSEIIACFPKFPTMAIANSENNDIFYDKKVAVCSNCQCAQLTELVDPAILYSPLYTNATFSPVWNHHHETFAEFILMHNSGHRYMEIGANNGALYEILKEKQKCLKYSVLDMYKHNDLPNDLFFYEGNCENFDFHEKDVLILSHVFEHLYNPNLFLENARKNSVQTLFISIPNFDKLLDDKSIILLHSQHTFFCGKKYIDYLCGKHGYFCEAFFEYNGSFKSHMLKYSLGSPHLTFPTTDISLYKNIYQHKMMSFSSKIVKAGYLMPSGIYGQYVYSTISNKSFILGFLDNNPSRHGYRLYGTNKLISLPQKVNLEKSVIYLIDCPYRDEILHGLLNFKQDFEIIML